MAHAQVNQTRSDAIAVRQIIKKGWSTKQNVPITKTKLVEGKPVQYLANEEVDQAEVMKDVHIADFNLETIIANDQVNLMSEGRLSQSQLMMIDHVNDTLAKDLDKMDAEEWAEKYMKKSKEE